MALITEHDLTINTDARTVWVKDTPVQLTPKEFDLLTYLVRNKNYVISKPEIVAHLASLGRADKFDVLYAHIKNLRQKLTAAGCIECIRSVYGIGYRFYSEDNK